MVFAYFERPKFGPNHLLGPVLACLGLSRPAWELSWVCFGLSWACFGRSWACLGAVLGLSWPVLTCLGPVLACLDLFWVCFDLSWLPLGPVFTCPENVLGHFWTSCWRCCTKALLVLTFCLSSPPLCHRHQSIFKHHTRARSLPNLL